MIIIDVESGEAVEKAVKRLKKKFDTLHIALELRNRMYHRTRGEKRREQVLRAIRRRIIQQRLAKQK